MGHHHAKDRDQNKQEIGYSVFKILPNIRLTISILFSAIVNKHVFEFHDVSIRPLRGILKASMYLSYLKSENTKGITYIVA